jgi:hypothetical protein
LEKTRQAVLAALFSVVVSAYTCESLAAARESDLSHSSTNSLAWLLPT